MDIGAGIFPTLHTLAPVELGRAVEERGFESLWFPEHSHIPVSRRTPWGGRAGAPELPEFYWQTLDQFVALSAVAATTTKLRVATGINLVAQHDPLWLAKQVASLDQISNGRFIFGIGYGWNIEELNDHGVAYTDRRARVRESILAMIELWTNEVASFDGTHVSFEPSWAEPKPVQLPHPPIVLGGSMGPRTARDVAEFADAWMPIAGRTPSIADGIGLIERACEAIGRDPATVSYGVFFPTPELGVLESLAELGVTRAVLNLDQGSPDDNLAQLDRLAPLIEAARHL